MNKNAEAEKPGASLASAFFVNLFKGRLTKENKEEKKMNVKKAIDLADKRMPGNGYETAEKCSWLTTIETMWIKFLRQLGYIAEDVSISEDESEKELLIDEPYCECYVMWLIMKMHYYNGEIELYNNSAEAFNTHFEEAQKAFIRENRAKKSHSFSSYKEV